MISQDTIHSKLKSAFAHDHIEVIDAKGDGYHYELIITSATLAQQPALDQHRAVYKALGKDLTDAIHALSIKVKSPTEESE